MKQRIILWISLMVIAVGASAQNRIDRFVDNESTIGQSKFTSVVERDPQTREVVRVVKVRELSRGIDINACLKKFEAERLRVGEQSSGMQKAGRYTHKVENGERHTIVLAVEGERQNRIYMLQYTGNRPMQATDGKVTIVIRMK